MNATPSQPHPAEWTETQQLLPSVERDLPAGRHQFHKEQMMAQIHEDLRGAARPAAPAVTPQRRNPFLRRAILLPAGAFALAGAVVAGVALSGGNGDGGTADLATGPALTTQIGAADPKGAPQLLDRISLAAADTSGPTVHDGQFTYIASKVASTYPKTVDDKTTIVSQELHDRRVWLSPDGKDGWLIEAGETSDEGMTLAGPNPFAGAYNALVKLPTDPDALLRHIYKGSDADRDPEVPRDQAAFVAIGELLNESYPPADLSVALYKAAAKIPGVVAVDDAVDAMGRHGIAVARQNDTDGQRTEWIFDKKTLALLGERTVQVKADKDGEFKAGTVMFTSAITQRAVVDGNKQPPGKAS
ncbi:hypothetical protein SALBM311S_08630 [Streptomyces alboniger]